jgi:hypothetical protein
MTAISIALGIGAAVTLGLLTDEAKAQIRRLGMTIARLAASRLPDEQARGDAQTNWPGYVAFICDEERRHLRALWEALELLLVAQRRIRKDPKPLPPVALATEIASRRPRVTIAVAELVVVEQYIQRTQREAIENGEPELVRDLGRLLAGVRRRVAPDGSTDAVAKAWLTEASGAISAGDAYPAEILRRFLK